MRATSLSKNARWMAAAAVLWMAVAGFDAAQAQSVGGRVYNSSVWGNHLPPPGDGSGQGDLRVGLWLTEPAGTPDRVIPPLTNGPLPILNNGPYGFTFSGLPSNASYQVMAWIDGNGDSGYDRGEPRSFVAGAVIVAGVSVYIGSVSVTDDIDNDKLPDWWEYHWFGNTPDPLSQGGSGDPDKDGLSNAQEAEIGINVSGMAQLNPAHWDSDGDGMDDKWEYDHYSRSLVMGLNPAVYSKTNDWDGDGLTDWQEYGGVDGRPPMESGGSVDGAVVGKVVAGADDSLNPLDIDTDYDMLIDSFEVAWYDPANNIDPRAGLMTDFTATDVDTTYARADSDQDGLANYREQCLLAEFREGAPNGDKWVWEGRVPFPFLDYRTDGGTLTRICMMTVPLALGVDRTRTLRDAGMINRNALRNHEWTDPTEGTGYMDGGENLLLLGHDSDGDGLPDGWEVQFNLNPRDKTGINGKNGDPDGDFLYNLTEYRGQDGNRFTTRPYINGTGDETNPNEYNHRPDSAEQWRWMPADPDTSGLTDPRPGTGISRVETAGSAWPTTNTATMGRDNGKNSDDDDDNDAAEIYPSVGTLSSSPVHSCDPYRPKSARIISPLGIPIPDPEPALATNETPAGFREDLQRREWTVECQVKLLGTNLTGELFDFKTLVGTRAVTIYCLALSNNIPSLSMHGSAGNLISVSANALPTNRWIHLAGVWSRANNALGLYVDGVLSMSPSVYGEGFADRMLPATNVLALGASRDGSFTNLLLDEVRIWGVARTGDEIATFANQLAPIANGDDVWIDTQSPQYYSFSDGVIVNGGSLFDGEPGVLLARVLNNAGNYWIDDGDGYYNAARDTVLARDTTLVEGLSGTAVANARWNDKDGNGVFSRDSLLAYYRFDDGGTSAEDFARRAKNGLIGAVRPEYTFGDYGYALPTNSFLWVTNDAAPIYGVDQRGADDSDHDGLPDGWETINHLDPYDDGAGQESTPGAKDGQYGPLGDPDHDGLVNLYEFWAGTNPRKDDSDGNSRPDTQEDRDGDGVVNIVEQELGSRPDMVDTDDDGLTDNQERLMGTGPANPIDPATNRAVMFNGGSGDYLEVPLSARQILKNWTLEAWVKPTNGTGGFIVRRVVEQLPGGTQAVNFVMGLEPNGSGGLRPYAGYIRTDGTPPYMIRGGTLPAVAAAWTHVAASYNNLNSMLSLYTNGSLVATTNTPYDPPLTGKGGETFLRIGESFDGGIDEVRVWGRARTSAEILATRDSVIGETATNGLVHDFRFDDGEANTNALPFGLFHSPNGYQDFTFKDDWLVQWRHALRRHGTVNLVAPGAIVPPPSLRVLLQPLEAIAEGAQWMIDGGIWRDSGDNAQGLTPGSHRVSFKPVTGWTAPLSEWITLVNGVATTITTQYLRNASIRITLYSTGSDPAVDANARWRVDNGNWLTNGVRVVDVSPGHHTIEFGAVPGYVTPLTLPIDLAPGEPFERNVEYAPITGALSAILKPAGAVTDGALWRYNAGSWNGSGVVVSNLPLGSYTVEFGPATRWITPASVSVALVNQNLVSVTGLYTQVTGISADIIPPEAIAAGAQWRLAGRDWTNSGAVIEVAPGSYTVSFKTLTDSWLTPGDVTATVVDQHVTIVPGAYYTIEMFGGVIGTNAGLFNRPSGLALDSLHRLYVADSRNDRIQMYDPVSRSWTIWGQSGSNPGEFSRPYGIAVDAKLNVYVADSNNDRIQIRNPSSGQWRVLGAGVGGLGVFNTPMDVAVDSVGNLYVADLYPNRVQKYSTGGVWSVFVAEGSMAGYTLFPRGLMVNSADNLLLSDDGTEGTGQSRVQRFSSTGLYMDLLGSRDSAEGGLRRPAGMSIWGTSLYLADVDNSRVMVTPQTGRVWSVLIGSNVLNGAEDVVCDPRGILYVADTGHNRILALPLRAGAFTNGRAEVATAALPGGTNGFVITWYGTLNWLYAVQYANSLVPPPVVWQLVPGITNIPGHNAWTNGVDRTTAGATNRFYRVLAY